MTSVAVCIPAFTEVAGIASTVESIWATGYPREQLQVVVAVDGGDSRVCAAAEAAGAEVVVVTPNQGSYAARNVAVDSVRDDVTVLLFTDADCVVSPGWIDEHLATLATAPLSGGGVRFLFAGDRPTPSEWVDSLRHLKQELYVTKEHWGATCNLAVRRNVFTQLRFDASLRTGGDADFGLRARTAGFDIAYSPDAWIGHHARATRQALFEKVRRIASGAARARDKRGDATRRKPRLTLGPFRRARAVGLRVGVIWAAEACLLDYRAQLMISRAARRGK